MSGALVAGERNKLLYECSQKNLKMVVKLKIQIIFVLERKYKFPGQS
jgi:hypothetical protein